MRQGLEPREGGLAHGSRRKDLPGSWAHAGSWAARDGCQLPPHEESRFATRSMLPEPRTVRPAQSTRADWRSYLELIGHSFGFFPPL
jgi:hypothetical protein